MKVAERRKTAHLVNHIGAKHIKAGYERPDGSYEDKMTQIKEKTKQQLVQQYC